MTLDLATLIENPAVSGFIALLLTMLLPADRLAAVFRAAQGYVEKFPILGFLAKVTRIYLEKVNADQELGKVIGATELAHILVDGAEQLKASGKLDGATAAAQITRQLEEKYGLDTDTARKVTEKAVLDLKMVGREVKQPRLPSEKQLTEADRAVRR